MSRYDLKQDHDKKKTHVALMYLQNCFVFIDASWSAVQRLTGSNESNNDNIKKKFETL